MPRRVQLEAIEQLLGLSANSEVREYFEGLELSYVPVTDVEESSILMNCFDVLLNQELKVAGNHRKQDWETGWGENLSEFMNSRDLVSLVPRYFGNKQIARLNQRFIRPVSSHFEAHMLSLLIRLVASKHLTGKTHIAEFGCGSGANLVDLRAVNQEAILTGLDWSLSSQALVGAAAEEIGDNKIHARNFDFFSPDYEFLLGNKSAVITVAALEQVGSNFRKFLDFVLQAKPDVCIHLEPIGELLDRQNIFDFLSLQYFQRRGYLSGYLTELRRLEARGEVTICEARRTFTGSQFIEGHSLVVWAPC